MTTSTRPAHDRRDPGVAGELARRVSSSRPLTTALSLLLFLTAAPAVPAADAPPPAPVPYSPIDNADITDLATYFQWRAVPGCDQFHIQVARDPDFTELAIDKRTTNKGFHKN